MQNIIISDIISKLPKYIKIPKKLETLLKFVKLSINKVTNLYLFLEHLYFSDLIKFLNEEYKKDITDEIIKEIKNNFCDKKKIKF